MRNLADGVKPLPNMTVYFVDGGSIRTGIIEGKLTSDGHWEIVATGADRGSVFVLTPSKSILDSLTQERRPYERTSPVHGTDVGTLYSTPGALLEARAGEAERKAEGLRELAKSPANYARALL